MAINQDVFDCDFGLLVYAESSHIRKNEEASARAQNILTNNTTLLEHVNPSHHPNPNFDKQGKEIALFPYIPTTDTV